MSGKSFLRGLGAVAKLITSPAAASVIGTFNPAAGAIALRIGTAIDTIEVAHVQAGLSGMGQQKSDFVRADFDASFSIYNAVLAATKGEQVVYSQTALQKAIDSSVQAKNDMAALLESMKVEKVKS